jgi:signal transduction histidine kinase
MQNDTSFARLVSLACHDVRTPLATVHGFVKTLERTVELDAPADRYVEMIEAASDQMAELLDELALAARIEAGRYEPALRHGGLDEVDVVVRGKEIDVSPVTDSSSRVVVGAELRDLGAAVAVKLLETLGGSVTVADATLTIRFA